MTTATKTKKTAKAEAETATKDDVLSLNQFVLVVAIANGGETFDAAAAAMHRVGVKLASLSATTSSTLSTLKRKGFVSAVKAKPGSCVELSLTDAGWDALAKTRAFYATERF